METLYSNCEVSRLIEEGRGIPEVRSSSSGIHIKGIDDGILAVITAASDFFDRGNAHCVLFLKAKDTDLIKTSSETEISSVLSSHYELHLRSSQGS